MRKREIYTEELNLDRERELRDLAFDIIYDPKAGPLAKLAAVAALSELLGLWN